MAGLPPLPDFIREQLGGKEFAVSEAKAPQFDFLAPDKWGTGFGPEPSTATDDTTAISQSYIPRSLKEKILAGDYPAFAAARQANQNDLTPNLTSIRNNEDKTSTGFVTVTNDSNGQKYRICASNTGWIWTYMTESKEVTDQSGKVTKMCVVQTGTYSKNGQFLGISYSTYKDLPTEVTALAIAATVSLVVGNMVKNFVLGMVYRAALAAAVDAAAAGAVAGGWMVSATAATVGATIVGTLAAGIVAAIVMIVIFFLADFIKRSYGIVVSIYNWDMKNKWSIVNWHADNAIVAGDKAPPWKAATLEPVQNTVPGPIKPIPSDETIAQYGVYSYQNDSEWLQGLGLAMSMKCSAAGGFYFKYVVHRFSNNRIGVSSNDSGSLSDFYNNDNTWRPSGDTSYTGPVDGAGLDVTIITDALNGARAYAFDVHIGLRQDIQKKA